MAKIMVRIKLAYLMFISFVDLYYRCQTSPSSIILEEEIIFQLFILVRLNGRILGAMPRA